MVVMASDGSSAHFSMPWLSRHPTIKTPPRPVPAGHFVTQERIMFSNPTQSKSRLSPAATISDDTLSALTSPLHCISILQPAILPQVIAFESWTISDQICLNCFTFAESRKSELWTGLCVFIFASFVFACLIEMNFSFKSLFAIWSLSPQRFKYYFFLSIVSWQYQKYSTILILVLCLRLLCVTPLVCSSYSSFALSFPFAALFTSRWTSISVFYINTACDVVMVLVIFAKYLSRYVQNFTCTYRDTHTQAHMYNQHTCIISTQEEVLEIILDLPFGFPINNIISHTRNSDNQAQEPGWEGRKQGFS